MRPFNVLERALPLNQNYLLEASAGTGKTFSIEHLVVRLIIAGEAIEKLLVVTFTRAATRDLKIRIRKNIQTVLWHISRGHSPFDYVQEIVGSQAAQKRLETALLCFDQAQINTIHGFCLRMLKEYGFAANVRVDLPDEENSVPVSEVMQLIRDFLRTDFTVEKYGAAALKLLMGESLEEDLYHYAVEKKEIEKQHTYQEAFQLFCERARQLKNEGLTTDYLLEAASHYKDISNRKRELKPEIRVKLEKLGELDDFEFLIEDQLQAFKNPKKEEEPPLIRRLKELMFPLIHKNVLLARVAGDCQQKFYRYLEREEKYRCDDLLTMMKKALCHPPFKELLQKQYSAGIIDEFQDTDATQWEIFRSLFLQEGHRLYLVGDPKQSIYAFRQADIYTYLQAAKDLGHMASLTTNYRSHPPLIAALNTLFSKPGFLQLPKSGECLTYREISPAPEAQEFRFKDKLGSVHFAFGEEEQFFPFIVQEIERLVKEDGFHYAQFAVLVSDRFQAERLMTVLRKWKIPAVNQKQSSLLDLPAYPAMKELLRAALSPKDLSLVKQALGGNIFGWTHEEIKTLDPLVALQLFHDLHQKLMEEGFAPFFKAVMGGSLAERMVARVDGDQLYYDIYKIAEILIESRAAGEKLLQVLEQLKTTDDEEMLQIRRAQDKDAVRVMTIHSSKGLEFDIVFAPGLMKCKKIDEPFIPVEGKLRPVIDQTSPEYEAYCREMNAEKMRLLYVALTRAKYRVYVPAELPLSEDIRKMAPSDLFLHYHYPAEGHGITLSTLDGDYKLSEAESETQPDLQPPEKVQFDFPLKQITSFSALARHAVLNNEAAPKDFASSIKTPHTLPAGSETGNLLHTILEKIPLAQAFQWQRPEDFHPYITPFLERTPYREWRDVIAQMICSAFHTPLMGQFALSEIEPSDTYREIEFLYKGATHVKGFMDLVFRHRGKYYILDWKSNWLEHYTPPFLAKAMVENDYLLQGRIYAQALQKYLALVEKRPFEEIFGGAIYIFLRGTGVYHFDPLH